MPIPLGILAVAGAGGGALVNDYERISTITLSSTASSIDFTSIPSTYRHLQVRAVVRNTNGGSLTPRPNGDTGVNFAWHHIVGNGSSVASSGIGSRSAIDFGRIVANSYTTDSFSAYVIDILDYANTSKNKTLRSFSGIINPENNDRGVYLSSGLWISTTAITSLTFVSGSNFQANTRFSLYGIR